MKKPIDVGAGQCRCIGWHAEDRNAVFDFNIRVDQTLKHTLDKCINRLPGLGREHSNLLSETVASHRTLSTQLGNQPFSHSFGDKTTSPLNRGWEGGTPTQQLPSRGVTREFRPDFARTELSFSTTQARERRAGNSEAGILLIKNDLLWRRGWDSHHC